MSTQPPYLWRDEDRITFYESMRACAMPGPYGAVCTEAFPTHQGPHRDAREGVEWVDGWADEIPEGDAS